MWGAGVGQALHECVRNKRQAEPNGAESLQHVALAAQGHDLPRAHKVHGLQVDQSRRAHEHVAKIEQHARLAGEHCARPVRHLVAGQEEVPEVASRKSSAATITDADETAESAGCTRKMNQAITCNPMISPSTTANGSASARVSRPRSASVASIASVAVRTMSLIAGTLGGIAGITGGPNRLASCGVLNAMNSKPIVARKKPAARRLARLRARPCTINQSAALSSASAAATLIAV